MNSKFVRVGLTTSVLVLAFAGLLWSTLRDGTEYYKHVEEVSVHPESWYGKRLQLQPTGAENPYAEVIGVVEHIRAHDLARAVRPQIYVSHSADPSAQMFVVMKTAGDPAGYAAVARAAVFELDAELLEEEEKLRSALDEL